MGRQQKRQRPASAASAPAQPPQQLMMPGFGVPPMPQFMMQPQEADDESGSDSSDSQDAKITTSATMLKGLPRVWLSQVVEKVEPMLDSTYTCNLDLVQGQALCQDLSVRYYRKLGKRLQQASYRVKQGMGEESFKKNVLEKLPLSLTDDIVLSIAMLLVIWWRRLLVLRWRLLVLRWRPGPSVAAPGPLVAAPGPGACFAQDEFNGLSSMVLERRAPPPIMFDQPEQAADNGEEEDSADAGLRHEAADDRVICVICMDVINEHQEEARLPCNHVLHHDCVDRWRSVAGVGEDQCPTRCERSVQQRDQFAPADDLDQRRSENQVVAEEAAAQAIDGQNEFL
ncbi:unnamed protein product [Effrenium voratum]|nr:unnamed protein product [Effrenium voratum]